MAASGEKVGGLHLSAAAPRVAGSVQRVPQAAEVAAWCAQGLEVAELRLDKLAQIDEATLAALFAAVGAMPSIVTVRAAFEGGSYSGDEASRAAVFAALPGGDALDIELAAPILPQVAATARAQEKTLIISRHNFAAADSATQLDDAMAQALAAGADVFKCACLCVDAAALEVLRDFTQRCTRAGQKCIAIGMDDGSNSTYARQARQELPACGSCLAFARLEGEGSAPGQLSLQETVAACRRHGG